jgi:hypothetical protein
LLCTKSLAPSQQSRQSSTVDKSMLWQCWTNVEQHRDMKSTNFLTLWQCWVTAGRAVAREWEICFVLGQDQIKINCQCPTDIAKWCFTDVRHWLDCITTKFQYCVDVFLWSLNNIMGQCCRDIGFMLYDVTTTWCYQCCHNIDLSTIM